MQAFTSCSKITPICSSESNAKNELLWLTGINELSKSFKYFFEHACVIDLTEVELTDLEDISWDTFSGEHYDTEQTFEHDWINLVIVFNGLYYLLSESHQDGIRVLLLNHLVLLE